MVEHNLAKVGVASSSLVSRSINFSFFVAGWQSGYAAACKAADVGSIPAPAFQLSPGGEIGRRKGLKIPRDLYSHAGSIPAPGTTVQANKHA